MEIGRSLEPTSLQVSSHPNPINSISESEASISSQKMSADLPEECWDLVFRFLGHQFHLEPLSLVCKQFLSITNRLRFSLTICDPTVLVLPQLFARFPRLRSIDLSHFRGDLHGVLHQISRSGLDLDSLNLSNQTALPVDGLRALGSKMRNLRAFCCSNMGSLRNGDLLVIAEYFPFLEELDISFPVDVADISMIEYNNSTNFTGPVSAFGVKALSMVLRNLRKVNLSGNYFINDDSIVTLCKNCEFLEEVAIFDCVWISQAGIASAIRERPNLTSISVSNFGNGTKKGVYGRPNVTLDFICSLVSLKSLTAIDLSHSFISDELLCSIAAEGLPLTKLILQGTCNYSYAGIFCLLSKCQLIQYLDLQNADFLDDQRIGELSVFLRNLISINLSGSRLVTNSTFFTLTRKCPLLNEIKMERTDIGKKGVEDSLMEFAVNSQVKSLHLAHNSSLRDESIKIFASICPNLQLLDLSSCWGVSEEGVVEVLKRCCKIRLLSLAFCSRLKLFGIDFEVPELKVLNLSGSGINDKALSIVSKSCCGLLHLDVQNCSNVTEKGVKEVVANCGQLREINLKCCDKVGAHIVAWMVVSRPSLRKIMAPPGFRHSESQRELFLRHGCLAC